MKIVWPPQLGLGTLLNLATLSPATRPLFRWWVAPVAGVATVLLIACVDYLFFGGATLRRLPDLGAHPPLGSRVLVVVLGSVVEELFFRAFLASLAALLAYVLLSVFMRAPRAPARVAGVLAAALAVGLWHTATPGDLARVLVVNGIAQVVYGWMFWRRGLETAILTHMAVTACLLIVIPALR